MHTLHSKRLYLLPLTLDDIYLLASQNRTAICRKYSLEPNSLLLADEDFAEELATSYSKIAKDLAGQPEAFPWNTVWWIVEKDTYTNIGGIGMNGPPDKDGSVITGYYIDRRSEGKGYATEALIRLAEWAFTDARLRKMIAFTLPDGYASQRVLLKSGFICSGPENDVLKFEKGR